VEQLKLPFEKEVRFKWTSYSWDAETIDYVIFVDRWDVYWVLHPDGTTERLEDYCEYMEL